MLYHTLTNIKRRYLSIFLIFRTIALLSYKTPCRWSPHLKLHWHVFCMNIRLKLFASHDSGFLFHHSFDRLVKLNISILSDKVKGFLKEWSNLGTRQVLLHWEAEKNLSYYFSQILRPNEILNCCNDIPANPSISQAGECLSQPQCEEVMRGRSEERRSTDRCHLFLLSTGPSSITWKGTVFHSVSFSSEVKVRPSPMKR